MGNFEKYISEIVTDEDDKKIMTEDYEKLDEENIYVLKKEKDHFNELRKIRAVFLKYNKENEINTILTYINSLDDHADDSIPSIAISPDGNNLYLVEEYNNRIFWFSRNSDF